MTRTFPGGSPGQPIGIYNPNPWVGGVPWYPVGDPRFPGGPGIPIVMNPAPLPGTTPAEPNTPTPNPGTIPTIPVGNPKPAPTEPNDDSTAFWSPWPLPPRGNQVTFHAEKIAVAAAEGSVNRLISQSSPESSRNRVAGRSSRNDVRHQQLMDVADPTPDEDLRYRGGRIIRDLFYVNLYVSGDTDWSAADVERIDSSLSAAMRDAHLNNVLLQYYDNQSISSTALPSHPLVGYTPKSVSRGDLQNYVTWLHQKGFLKSYDLANTVFNFLLPPGTVLTSDRRVANAQPAYVNGHAVETHGTASDTDATDSLNGLGGYHGSVVTASGERIYFAVDVYSQRFANGATNGIPVFGEPWKNVVATLYHQLIEARTDPDVEDAIRNSSDLISDRYLGWVSDSGQEIGDLPIRAGVPVASVIREVPLADGSGFVPVQLPYSNFVHGPEGPISQPHPLSSR
jgi:hypothetical protein